MASTTVATRTVSATTKPGTYVVSSLSLPGMFNLVEVSSDGSMVCSCKGARYHSTCICRELVTAEIAPFVRTVIVESADPFEGLAA